MSQRVECKAVGRNDLEKRQYKTEDNKNVQGCRARHTSSVTVQTNKLRSYLCKSADGDFLVWRPDRKTGAHS